MSNAKAQQKKQVVSKVLDGIEALAVSKFKLPDGCRDGVKPGNYPINATVHVVGEIQVGEDYEQRIVGKIPLMKLVLKLASQVSDERLRKMLASESLDKISKQEEKEFSERIQGIWKEMAESTRRSCKGKVTSDLVFTRA